MGEPVHRRNMLSAAFAATAAFFAGAVQTARAKDNPDKPRVAYHLCDLDKVAFVLGNIRNHFDGMGGPDKVTIALVVHGPALKAFHAASARHDLAQRLDEFVTAGLRLDACGNTMRAQQVTLKELLPGFTAAEQGGVVRLTELQAAGYAYLRP